jgi:hypothetical protein
MPVSDELEKTPTADTSVNKPESGTYGEKAELARLSQSLPPMTGSPGVGGAPSPVGGRTAAMPGRPDGRPKNAPPNVPGGMLAPTQRPNVPLDQPLAAQPQMPPRADAADQQRLAILDALSTHPDVSTETREWAQMLVEALIGSRR